MYVRAISTRFSRGRSTPAMRAMCAQPCRCLCLGLRLQMTNVTPRRRTTLQCSQMGFTLERTFTDGASSPRGSGQVLQYNRPLNPMQVRGLGHDPNLAHPPHPSHESEPDVY